MKKAKLYLIGSGPGDPDLITLKALKVIKIADVILYDSLAPEQLLNEAKYNCTLLYAGKRAGQVSTSQEEIYSMISEFADKSDVIVRLKGGDPMIFGRSFEEILWARSNDIEVEVIPGISTFNAFSAQFQAPITKRQECYGFWVISATTHLKVLSDEIKIAATSSSNIIIYMGLYKLSSIVEEFKKYKPNNYPIGVFQDISHENTKSVIATLEDIEERTLNCNFVPPAIVVVGNVLNDIK